MFFSYWKANGAWQRLILFFFLVPLLVLAGCGDLTAPPPSPGQQLLVKVSQKLTSAKNLHAIFNWNLTGAGSNRIMKTEVWNEATSKNRVVVLQSTVPTFPIGTIAVTDGQQEWLYRPSQKVVYTGTSSSGSTANVTQNLSPLDLIQQTLNQNNATLNSSSASVNGHTVDDVHVISNSSDSTVQMSGDVYVDKTTQLPVQLVLNTHNGGSTTKEVIDVLSLTLNSTIPDSTFTFVPPSGTRVLPLAQNGPTSLTLAQAEQQAGYHLLSIPASQTAYKLQNLYQVGPTGQYVYELNYVNGNNQVTIDEGKSVTNPSPSGKQVTVRGTTGTLSTDDSGDTILFWTENGIGVAITATLNNNQILAVAQMLT